MFDVEAYYELAHSGEKLTDEQNDRLIAYMKSFAHVVIWGGSFLGNAIGEYLLNKGVQIENYWDLRYEELQEIHGIRAIAPFETQDKENTLVVFCIGNNVIRGALLQELQDKNYRNVLRGDYLYEGMVCPFDVSTDIESKQCQGSMCCRSMFCERLSNIVKNRKKLDNPLHTFNITLIINQRCSLKCKCCTSYMNQYPLEKRKDIPVERICDDIDKFFEAMDSVGTITVMGGEPFMHPDLSTIVKKLLTKNNIGIISIATSGTYPIKAEQLDGLEDKRVNISFSNYEQSLNSNQIKMMYNNIEMVKNAGLSYTVGVTMPEWLIPSTLYDLGDSEETMIAKKQGCIQPPRCMQVKNGKLYPCDFGQSLHSLGLADYEMDYVDIEHATSTKDLKEKIRNYIDQPYYRSCGHCSFNNGTTSKAAEQGYMDFTKPLDNLGF